MAYKIYHHEQRRVIVIEGTTETFPERSLVATNDGTNITIQTFGSGGIVLGPLPFDQFARIDGAVFGDMAAAFLYVTTELDRIALGAEVQNEFAFPSAAVQWAVNHSFGYKPSVEVLDLTGTAIEGCVQHIDDNNLVVSFLVPTTGAVSVT